MIWSNFNDIPSHKPKDNLFGKYFGKLEVIGYERGLKRDPYWVAQCHCGCGEVIKVRGNAIKKRVGCHAYSCSFSYKKRKGGKYMDIENLSYIKRKFGVYQRRAKRSNLEFKLSLEEFSFLIKQNCTYCGAEPRMDKEKSTLFGHFKWNGIDRIDSSQGYFLDNVTPCCSTCNNAKSNLSLKEFLEWIKRLIQHNKTSTTIPKGSTSQANGDGNGSRLKLKETKI